MSTRFIALHCGEEAEALLSKHPNAFLLLTQIAMRAQWKDNPITGMKAGEAFIGDYKNAGIHSQKAYRHAKDKLVSCMLARFKGANKGTVATLTSASIFSTTAPDKGEQGANKGQPRGEPGATTHTDTQNTLNTPVAPNGASSDSPQKSKCPISWNEADGFTGITDQDRAEWGKAYPAVNLDRAIAAASDWLKRNPTRRKKNYGRFLSNWLAKNQERGGEIPRAYPVPPAPPPGSAIVGGRTYTQRP